MPTKRSALMAAVLIGAPAVLALEAGDARAQVVQYPGQRDGENIDGITVSGKATVFARPNRMEIDLQVASASELTSDAIVKYRDAKRRIEEAFENLQLDRVAVEERGLLVDQKGMMQNRYYDGMPNPQTKTEVQLSRKLVVTCSEIRELDEEEVLQLVARLIDVAQDAGGSIGVQPGSNAYQYSQRAEINLVRFIVDDFEAVQEQAYEAAVADARDRAGRLARLSGAELGSIVAIREVAVPGDPLPNVPRVVNPFEEPPREGRLESTRLQEVPVRVELLVRFQVRPSDGEGTERP